MAVAVIGGDEFFAGAVNKFGNAVQCDG